MPDDSDTADDYPAADGIEDTPVVTCRRCDREWTLSYELDDLQVGNQALEQFALDHKRHTGHYPDDVAPWVATCRQCPAVEEFLSEQSARRWAEIHARHTRHQVALAHSSLDEAAVVRLDDA